MGSNVLKYKESTKYLGLILDANLTWKSHIKQSSQKLIKYTGVFSKIRYCLRSACRKTVYIALTLLAPGGGGEGCFPPPAQ